MPRSANDVSFICPNCRQPIDPSKPNAMLSAATQQWQHTDCWRLSAPAVPPEAPVLNQPRRSGPSRPR